MLLPLGARALPKSHSVGYKPTCQCPGVLCYKARDLADSLDGVVARGPGARALPTPGTQVTGH